MTLHSIDDSQRKAARIAGLACLISFAIVIAVNFGIFARLIIHGNPAETARNILAHETLFRIGIVGDMLYSVGVIILLAALYIILKPVNQNLALIAAFGRLVHALTWLLVTLNLFTALRLLNDSDYARAFMPDQLPVLVRLYLTGYDQYYVGLLFWSLSSAVVSYLWLKSNYIPKSIAAFGILSSVWCVVCTILLYIFPDFAEIVNLWWFDSAMTIFEIVVSILLLFRGLKKSEIAGPGPVSG
jgi:hypothetical protein